jgi:mannosyltransferase
MNRWSWKRAIDSVRKATRVRGHGPWVKRSVLLIVFVFYSLQVSTLTLQSLWFDEVMALKYTSGSLSDTVRTIVQPYHNGPLFYLLLFGWRRLVGDSDFAVRFVSVVLAVLTVPLLFQWTRRLLTDRTAVTAVWLFVCSPFVFWLAQEAKMYALHMLVAVASSLVLLEAFRKGGWWRWPVYAVLVSAVLYSHFFGACLVASQAAMALLLGWRRRKRLLAYATAMLLLALAHLPLARHLWRVLLNYQPRDIWKGFVPLDHLLRDAIGHYFYRLPVELVSQSAFLLPAGLIAAGALLLLLLLRPRTRPGEAGVILLQAFAPILVFYVISFRIPVYGAKYLSATLPALLVLVAWGVEALARVWRPLGVPILVLGTLMLNGVARDLTSPAVQREDWRFAANYVDVHEGTNDLVLIFAHYTRPAFERYYHGESDVRGFGGDPQKPWPILRERAKQYDRLWLVLSHDQAMAPGHRLEDVATNQFLTITQQFPSAGRIRVIGYQVRYEYPALPREAQPLDVCFQNGLCLVGYRIDATDLAATERISHPPSNWIHVVLYWRREPQLDATAFRPLVRLVDGSFAVWGGNMERRPDLFDRRPPDQWSSDTAIETHFDLNLNPVTPPGTYRLEVSLAIEGDENQRMTVTNPPPDVPPDRFVFETIRIHDR